MNLLQISLLTTESIFPLIALVTALAFIHYRDRSRLDIALMFGSLGVGCLLRMSIDVLNLQSELVNTLSWLFLIGQPYLLLRIVSHFRPVPRPVEWFALLSMLTSLAFAFLGPFELTLPTFILVAYFVLIDGYATFAFVNGAFFTGGVTRRRMSLAAVGSGLIVLAILLSGVVIDIGGSDQGAFIAVLITGAAGLSYYLGFASPLWLQRIWQFSELYEFVRELYGPSALTGEEETFRVLTRAGTKATGGIAAEVAVWNEAKGSLTLPAQTGSSPLEIRADLTQGLIGSAWRERRALVATRLSTMGAEEARLAASHLANGMYAIPIATGEHGWGVLLVFLRREPLFSADELELLTLLAKQVAQSLGHAALLANEKATEARARSFAEINRQADRLALLNRVARATSATLNLDELLEIVYREITTVLTVDAFFIALYDPATTELDFRIRVDRGVREPIQRRMLSPGLTSLIISSQKPLLIRCFDDEKDSLPAAKTWGTMESPQSWMGVPMLVGDNLVGVISSQAYRANLYGDSELELLSTIADTVAVAAENARLFGAEAARREELAALYDLSRMLADASDVETACQMIAQHAALTVRVTFARVMLLEGDEYVIRAVHPSRAMNRDLGTGGHLAIADLPRCCQALTEAGPLLLNAESTGIAEEERQALFLDLAKTVCLVPLRVRARPFGLIALGEERNSEREPFTPEKLHLARSIGEQAASAIHRITLRDQTERRLQRLDSLRVIDQSISSVLDLRIALSILLDQVVAQLRVDAADVLLLDSQFQALELGAERGFRTIGGRSTSLRSGGGAPFKAIIERRRISIDNLIDSEFGAMQHLWLADEGFVAYHAVPLLAKGQVRGVLEVFHRAAFRPDAEWLNFLETLAGQAAIAIDNASLFTRLQRSNLDLALAYEATIEGWTRALDLRDRETEGHTQRVVELALSLARAFHFNEMELAHIRRGALLHDIGKMGIPDSILLKPGPLTEQEWVIMRRHPDYAREMLSPIEYLRPAIDIPYCHHERWDGSGYPRGLEGEALPLVARIFAVVDVWDALRSDRPYRAAWPVAKVQEHILARSGSHFDPKVVEAFFDLHDRMRTPVSLLTEA